MHLYLSLTNASLSLTYQCITRATYQVICRVIHWYLSNIACHVMCVDVSCNTFVCLGISPTCHSLSRESDVIGITNLISLT